MTQPRRIELSKLIFGEITALVAEHVAGIPVELHVSRNGRGLVIEKETGKTCDSYATSADAVMPLLEKFAWRGAGNRCGSTHASTVLVWGKDGREYMGQADHTHGKNSFALAACIALLRAHGFEVI